MVDDFDSLDFPKHRRYEVIFAGVDGPILIEVPFDERSYGKEQREADVWSGVYKTARHFLLSLDRRRFMPGYYPEQPGECYKIERVQ